MGRREKKQLEVAGTERPTIEEIDIAAIAYRKVRDERMALTKREVPLLEELAAVLAKHKIEGDKTYEYEDEDGETRIVSAIATKVKVRVRKVSTKPATDEGGRSIVGDNE